VLCRLLERQHALARVAVLCFVVSSMLAMGAGRTLAQILEPLRDARLVALSLVANFVLMPLCAFVLAKALSLDEPLGVGLLLPAKVLTTRKSSSW
jgi:bile acid:Na+ symporter, BASS family